MTDETTRQGGSVADGNAADNQQQNQNNDDTDLHQQAGAQGQDGSADEGADDAGSDGGDQRANKDDDSSDSGKGNKNRTGKYIRSLQQRLADSAQEKLELQQRLEAIEKRIGSDKTDEEPTLEAYDYDVEAFTKAHTTWATRKALEERDQTREQSRGKEEFRKTVSTYNDKVNAFAEEHPDFVEAVESMPFQLTQAQQLAIMRHENGPQIAYHLANHDEDAFALASVRDELADQAVKRIASRLSAARKEPTNTRPVTKAPDPAPKVSGRSKNEPDPTKLTDDDWYARNKH